MAATGKAGVGLALEQHTYGTLCYVADIQPGGGAALHGCTVHLVPLLALLECVRWKRRWHAHVYVVALPATA